MAKKKAPKAFQQKQKMEEKPEKDIRVPQRYVNRHGMPKMREVPRNMEDMMDSQTIIPGDRFNMIKEEHMRRRKR